MALGECWAYSSEEGVFRELELPEHIDCFWMCPRKQTWTYQSPIFSEREFKGIDHKPSQSYTPSVAKPLGQVFEWREKVRERGPREGVLGHTQGCPWVVCCYGHQNHRMTSAILAGRDDWLCGLEPPFAPSLTASPASLSGGSVRLLHSQGNTHVAPHGDGNADLAVTVGSEDNLRV